MLTTLQFQDTQLCSWMASLTQWTWIWANSRREWKTGKPGVLQSMGWQRAGHNSATKKQWEQQRADDQKMPPAPILGWQTHQGHAWLWGAWGRRAKATGQLRPLHLLTESSGTSESVLTGKISTPPCIKWKSPNCKAYTRTALRVHERPWLSDPSFFP